MGTGDINHISNNHSTQTTAIPLFDNDTYMHVLTKTLITIHDQFYIKQISNVKTIIPKLKNSLIGCHLFFTSLFPTNTLVEHADIACHAQSFGATIHSSFNAQVNYVVAGRITEKCLEARGKCSVVWGEWVWESCYGFEKLDSYAFNVFKDNFNQVPPHFCITSTD